MQLYEFDRTTNAFNFVFEKELEAGTPDNPSEIIVKMPQVSANKRGINDIGWATNGDNVILYGTLARDGKNPNAIWQEIEPYHGINKVVSYLKITNSGDACRIEIRAIFN